MPRHSLDFGIFGAASQVVFIPPKSGKYHFFVVKIPLAGQVATCCQNFENRGRGANFPFSIFVSRPAARREFDRFQANPWRNASRRLESKAKSGIFCTPFSQNRVGFGSQTPADSTTPAATLSEPTANRLAGARGTEIGNTIPLFRVPYHSGKEPKKW